MPLQATSGAASYDAFGGGAAAVPNYIEDVFSTFLYTGTGSALTVTNGIDLAGKGGLVWVKRRDTAVNNFVFDTARGVGNYLITNSTGAQSNLEGVSAFNSNGFSVGTAITTGMNTSGGLYASWTFRKQPKFFDVVTFTSDGTTAQAISHSLGSVPAFIVIKRTDSTGNWIAWHRGDGTTDRYTWSLNNTAAAASSGSVFVSAGYFNSTSFQPNRLDDHLGNKPVSGGTYVAYLFAHNAGGFGLTGTDNVISCGSFTYNSTSGNTINLGYEPQWILAKRSNDVSQWYIQDTMRGMTADNTGNRLFPNTTSAEDTAGFFGAYSSGFKVSSGIFANGDTVIYIAIRRGPMKVPTSGTSVFDADAYTGNSTARVITTGFPSDLNIMANRTSDGLRSSVWDRLRGFDKFLATSNTGVETTYATEAVYFDNNSGYGLSTSTSQGLVNFSGYGGYVGWAFRRAPSFFDEVCYTGTGANQTLSHNLQAVPELIIVKNRSGIRDWGTGWASIGWGGRGPALNSNEIAYASVPTWWNSTAPTASVFTVGSSATTNGSGSNFVAYLFATCAGVSKVGSYTGTATTKQVDCGFTGGARFVLIKRTDSTGDWYVWDSARGIVAGNDPYLLLNSTAAEVTSTDYIDTYSAGFEISSTAPAAINASGGSFIFLAVA